jgi:hypothetical protein
VVLVDGALAAFLGRGAREVVPLLPQDEPLRSRVGEATARALADWCARTGRAALGWSPEAAPRLAEGPLAAFLAAAGFERSGPGYRLAPARAAVSMADAGALEAAADALGVQDAPDPGED